MRGDAALNAERFAGAGQNEVAARESGNTLERMVLLLKIQEIRRRDSHPVLSFGFVKAHNSICVSVRKWTKQHGVKNTEDCRVRADAKRQGNDRDYCKARTLQQTPEAVANIFYYRFHSFIQPSNRVHPVNSQTRNSTFASSLVTQCHQRIDFRRAARRDITREQGHQREQQGDCCKRRRISGVDVKQELF